MCFGETFGCSSGKCALKLRSVGSANFSLLKSDYPFLKVNPRKYEKLLRGIFSLIQTCLFKIPQDCTDNLNCHIACQQPFKKICVAH